MEPGEPGTWEGALRSTVVPITFPDSSRSTIPRDRTFIFIKGEGVVLERKSIECHTKLYCDLCMK